MLSSTVRRPTLRLYPSSTFCRCFMKELLEGWDRWVFAAAATSNATCPHSGRAQAGPELHLQGRVSVVVDHVHIVPLHHPPPCQDSTPTGFIPSLYTMPPNRKALSSRQMSSACSSSSCSSTASEGSSSTGQSIARNPHFIPDAAVETSFVPICF